MPSYLGDYDGCANSREMKFIRAVSSFCDNLYSNKKLLIVSDGCQTTINLFNKYHKNWENVSLIEIDKQTLFSGNVRQKALELVDTEYVAYLDTDDTIGKNHLFNIVQKMDVNGLDFCWYNDWVKTGYGHESKKMRITKLEYGHCGTSTIAHTSKFKNGFLPSWFGCDGYGHDFKFITQMNNNTKKSEKINGCMYLVHHLKGTQINY